MTTSSSSSKKSTQAAWAKAGYNGGSAFGQSRIAPLSMAPLITPRPSNKPSSKSNSSSSAKQSTLNFSKATPRTAPTRTTQQNKGKGKENEPRSTKRSLALSISSSDDDCLLGAAPSTSKRSSNNGGGFFSNFKSILSRQTTTIDESPSSAPAARSQSRSLGKKVLNPSASQRRRGPTIDFDASQELPSGSREMVGESQRRKRSRVQEGGKGQLDLVPAGDHEGFGRAGGGGRASGSARKRVKRELELGDQKELEEERPVMLDLHRDSEEEPSAGRDSWEPEPSTLDDSLDAPRLSLKQSYAESSQSDSETLQQQLVPRRPQREMSAFEVPDSDDLVPDSDGEMDLMAEEENDDECEAPAAGMGAGMADDTGYAEMKEEAPKGDKEEIASPTGLMLPPQLTRRASDPAAITEEGESPDEVPETLAHFPSLSRDHSLVRTPSSVLMPPPPLPRTRSSPTSATAAAAAVEKVPSLMPSRSLKVDDEDDSAPLVLVPNTQAESHLISPPRRTSMITSPARTICDETQMPTPASRRPPPPRPTLTHPQSPRRAGPLPVTTDWATSLTSAWSGARSLSPPPPAEPRQSRLSEFFQLDGGAEEGETQVVQDSQPTEDGMTLEQAAAFREAFCATREFGRRLGSGLDEVREEVEEIEDGELERVEASQVEDQPWSPLGSPTKARFPALPFALGSGGCGVQGQSLSGEQRSAEQLAQLETQWESYWSEATYQPFMELQMGEESPVM